MDYDYIWSHGIASVSEEIACILELEAIGTEDTDSVMVLFSNPDRDAKLKDAIFFNLCRIFGGSTDSRFSDYHANLGYSWYTKKSFPRDFKPGNQRLFLISAYDESRYEEWISTGKGHGFKVVLINLIVSESKPTLDSEIVTKAVCDCKNCKNGLEYRIISL